MRTGPAVIEHQSPAVGLVPGDQLRVVGDPPPVRRIHRPAVESLVRRDAPRLCAPVHRHDKQVAVGAHLRVRVRVRCEAQLLTVGRERDLVRPAQREGRHVVIRPRRQIACCPARCRHHKQVAARSVAVFVPMAEEQMVIEPRLHFALFPLLQPLRRAGVVPAIGKHVAGKRERSSVRRPQQVFRPVRELRHADRIPSFERQHVHSRFAVPRGEERDPLRVRGPHRPPITAAARQLSSRTFGTSCRHRRHPHIPLQPIFRQARCRHRVRHPSPVRRNLLVADPSHRRQIRKRDRALFLRCRFRAHHQQQKHPPWGEHVSDSHRLLRLSSFHPPFADIIMSPRLPSRLIRPESGGRRVAKIIPAECPAGSPASRRGRGLPAASS